MAKAAGHQHRLRIIAHNRETGKDRRVLLGCQCSYTDVLRPHKARAEDPAFDAKLREYPHECCRPRKSQGTTPVSAVPRTFTLAR